MSSIMFCEKIAELKLHMELIALLSSDLLSVNSLPNTGKEWIVGIYLKILFKVIEKVPSVSGEIRENKIVDALQPFRDTKNFNLKENALYALVLQTHLTTEDENININSAKELSQHSVMFLVRLLKNTIACRVHSMYSIMSMLNIVNKLAYVNDKTW